MSDASRTIVIYGGGFAGHLAAAACAAGLGERTRIILITSQQAEASDFLYGNITAPSAYDFFRSVGLDEPTLMLQTRSTFSFGTMFENWPSPSSSWMQTYHLPLPVIQGVPFQQYLTARGEPLEPYLVSAQAARSGAFAHPPRDPNHPLSRAEYGYQFSVSELSKTLSERNSTSPIEVISAEVQSVQVQGDTIESILLDTGHEIEASFYIDCSGQKRRLIQELGAAFQTDRKLRASRTAEKMEQTGAPYRSLTATENGWQASTPLQGGCETLSIEHFDASNDAGKLYQDMFVGKLDRAWVGNCVAIGHSAWCVEPLTAAPMMLLQRDIERVLELIPVSDACRMEAREFNRRFEDDIAHANAFQRAMFEVERLPQAPYWQEATLVPAGDNLQRKLAQFKSRGIFVRFDLEPYNEEDWAILYNGMGLKPGRFDRQIDGVDKANVERQLSGLKHAVAQVVSKMPPHHLYIANLKQYLEKQKNA